MPKRNWRTFRPTSLQEAIEGCVDFARERNQMSIERIAEQMGVASKWTLYKYIESASLPVRLIPPFEAACGCNYVTLHLAASARKLVIDMPTGRKVTPGDIHAVQHACHTAVGSLLQFAAGKASAETTIAAVTDALERLARERAEVQRHTQPELNLS